MERNKRFCVPTAVIRDIIARERPGELNTAIAAEVGCDEGVIRRIMDPEAYESPRWLDFDKADRILCKLGIPLAWYTEPALVEVYEYLDGAEEREEARRRENNAKRAAKTRAARAYRKQRLAELKQFYTTETLTKGAS